MSLSMISFNSLNIFITVVLMSLSAKSDILVLSDAISLAFFFLVSHFPVSLHASIFLVEN